MSIGAALERPWKDTGKGRVDDGVYVERKSKIRMRKKHKSAFDTIICVAILVALALALTARYAAIAKINFEISQLDKELAELRAENERLEIQISRLSSLKRIEEIATNRLGMKKPQEVRTLAYNPSLSDGQMTAQADDAALNAQHTERRAGNNTFLAGIVDWLIGIAYAHRDGS